MAHLDDLYFSYFKTPIVYQFIGKKDILDSYLEISEILQNPVQLYHGFSFSRKYLLITIRVFFLN